MELHLILIVTTAICFFFQLVFRRFQLKTLPLTTPPSPRRLPILGHLHLRTHMPHHSFTRLANELGPIIYLQLGQIPTLIISSPQLACEILKTHDQTFASRPQLIAFQYLSFGCSSITFSPYGAHWRQVRKISVTELLNAKRVNSFRLIRDEEVSRLLSSVSLMSESEIDMRERLFSLANNVLCRVAFGMRFESESYRLAEVLSERQVLLAGFSFGDYFPCLEWVDSVSGLKRRLMRNLNSLRTVCNEIIREHMEKKKKILDGGAGDISEKEDFVDVLLRIQKDGDLEVPITDDTLKAVVVELFVVGTDTTAATLEWTMTELVRHKIVMTKVQKEVRQVVGRKGKVDVNNLTQLNYLRAVVKESLRLHPPVPLLVPRESIERCNINGYEIPEKTRVFINAYAIGRDPHSWDKPLEYNPERFIGTDIDMKGTQDFEFLPFGGGRRGCPGYSFALATIEITLARLLYHFDWSLPHGVEAEDVDLSEIFGLATRKKVPLLLVPTINKEYEFKVADDDLK